MGREKSRRPLSRRVAVTLGAALVSIVACSSPDDNADRTVAGPGSTNSTSATTAGAGEPGAGGAAGPADPGTPTPGASDGGVATPSTGPQPGGPAATDPSSPPSIAPFPAPGGVGAYAPLYLRAQESGQLLVNVRSQSGAAPGSRTVEHTRAVLGEVSGKTVGVGGGPIDGDARQWTSADIRSLVDSFGVEQSRDTAVMHLLFLRGGFAGNDTVLGVAVRSDVAAIFSDRVDEAAGPLSSRARIEDAVTLHEVGHLLGLVDLVLDTGRADPDHPGHSPNQDSVMYFAVESTVVGTVLTGGPPTEFDGADLADLAAIRGG